MLAKRLNDSDFCATPAGIVECLRWCPQVCYNSRGKDATGVEARSVCAYFPQGAGVLRHEQGGEEKRLVSRRDGDRAEGVDRSDEPSQKIKNEAV